MKIFVYDIPLYHEMLFNMYYGELPFLRELIHDGNEYIHFFLPFAKELFSKLYGNIIKKIEDDGSSAYERASKLHEIVDEAVSIEHLNAIIDHDPHVAINVEYDILKKILQSNNGSNRNQSNNGSNQNQSNNGSNRNQSNNGSNRNQSNNGSNQNKNNNGRNQNNNGSNNNNQNQQGEDQDDQLRSSLRAIKDQLHEKAKNLKQYTAIVGNEDADFSPDTSRKYLDFVDKIRKNEQLQKLIHIVGNLQTLWDDRKRSQLIYSRENNHNVILGSDLTRVLFCEHMNEDLFDAKFINDELLQIDIRKREMQKRGNVILCIDNSGSMTIDENDLYAKAVAFVFNKVLREEGRKLKACLFNTQVKKTFIDESTEDFLSILDHAPGGGTDVSKALRWAESVLDDKDDVIVITDGIFEREDINMQRKYNLMGIFIGKDAQKAPTDLFDKFIVLPNIKDNQEALIDALL